MQIHVGAIVQRCTVGVQLDLIGQKTGGFVKSTALANNSARNCFGKGGITYLLAIALELGNVPKRCGIVIPDVGTFRIQRSVVGDIDLLADLSHTVICITERLRQHGDYQRGGSVCVFGDCRCSGQGNAIVLDLNAAFVQNQTAGNGIGNDPLFVIFPFQHSIRVELDRPRQLLAGLQGSTAAAALHVRPIIITSILIEVTYRVRAFCNFLLSGCHSAIIDAAVVLDRCTVAWQLLDDSAFCCVGNGQRTGCSNACKVYLKQTQIRAVIISFTGVPCDGRNGNRIPILVLYHNRGKVDLLRLAVFTVCILHRVTIIVVNIAVDVFRVDGALPLHGGLCTIISRLTNCLFGKNIRVDVDSAFRAAVQPTALQIAGVFDIQTGQRDSFCDPCLVGDLILVEAWLKVVGEFVVCTVVDICWFGLGLIAVCIGLFDLERIGNKFLICVDRIGKFSVSRQITHDVTVVDLDSPCDDLAVFAELARFFNILCFDRGGSTFYIITKFDKVF